LPSFWRVAAMKTRGEVVFIYSPGKCASAPGYSF
jgi:hypothetical protein